MAQRWERLYDQRFPHLVLALLALTAVNAVQLAGPDAVGSLTDMVRVARVFGRPLECASMWRLLDKELI
jgi:hypothetical protein